jgi:conjugal transfer mating pair stabilization protein TraG
MDYVIYTFGGGEILWHVMNGLKILFGTDSSYFTSVGMLTTAIGLAYATLRALGSNAIPLFFKEWFLPTLLLTGLFFGLKTSVHIVDKVDSNFKYSKVDNIPIGIASIASLSSQIGEYLTENIETVFTTSDAERFSKVGPMFGARLIHESSKLIIKDPLTRLNIKDFVYQCFEWPYIKSNIAPGRLAAESSQDILGFVESNPHPMLGIYWRESDGNASFQNCKACAVKVRQLISVEVNQGLKSLAMSLFDSKSDPEATTAHLRKYASDAWGTLAKGSSSISNIVQQQLMLNAYHSASRNKNDELGLGRYDAALIHLEAERGQAVQDTTSLVKAAMSQIQLPNLHTIILALSLIFFTIIAPLTFLPKGTTYIMTWVRVMIWVTTWPVFFTVLNCLGQMFAAKALGSSLMGAGEGLSIQTQNGLSNVAYSAYCLVMGLQFGVAYLSWTLISQGGHAFSQLSSSFSQIGESFASKAGNELIDGNVTFDSQTLHSRSVANTQMAQQQLGASFNYGSRYDDGKVSLLHGTSGSLVAQEHQHNFGTNLSENNAISQVFAAQSQMALSEAQQDGINLQNSLSKGAQELVSFAKSTADTKGITQGFGETESVSLQKQAQELISRADRLQKDHNINSQVAFDTLVEASLGMGTWGISAGINAKAGYKASSADTESINKALNSEEGKQFSEGLNKFINYAKDNKGSISKTFNTQSLDQAQAHLSKAHTYADNRSANLSKAHSFSEMSSQSHQQGISSTSNTNDRMVGRIAEQFGGDRVAGAQHLAYHPHVGQQVSSDFINDSKYKDPTHAAKAEIYGSYHKNANMLSSSDFGSGEIESMRKNYNPLNQERIIDEQIHQQQIGTENELGKAEHDIGKQRQHLQQTNLDLHHDFNIEDKHTFLSRVGSKSGKHFKQTKLSRKIRNMMQDE